MSDPVESAINAEHARQERAWDAYCIAVDQAQENGAKLVAAIEALTDIRNRILCPVGPSPSLDDVAQIASAALVLLRTPSNNRGSEHG